MTRAAEDKNIRHAVQKLQQGGIVAHATEGVWGLACDPNNDRSVKRLCQLKGRNQTKGLILIAANKEMFAPWLSQLPPETRTKIESCWPGPVTWVVPNVGTAPDWIKGEPNTLAIRVPDHDQAQKLSSGLGGPIVSTSANPAGQPPALSKREVEHYFAGQLDYILHEAPNQPAPLSGRPSTIKDALTLKVIRL